MAEESKTDEIFGVMAEFESDRDLIAAANRVREEGYTEVDAYTPFPIHELPDALGLKPHRQALIMLIAGILGGVGIYCFIYWTVVIDYPIVVGGRPQHSWPVFIPMTFEVTILSAAVIGVLSLLALCGFPRPHHPVFNVPNFERASQDRFFLCIESTDQKFDREETAKFLQDLNPVNVSEVPFE